jgi:succinylarginine dihydrolase
MSDVREVNFDGLVGPTHNYAGLSHGNLASMTHRGTVSNPRAAALQGLAKMKALADLGLPQAILPPHERPHVATLRALGFAGSDGDVLRSAAQDAPELLTACASSSHMWVANAATVTPSTDTADGRVHFTPANLVSKFHRSLEPAQTARTLRAIFRDAERFAVHEPLPGGQAIGDEGAANHTRLATHHGARGVHLFVYGHRAFGGEPARGAPHRFASRQALEASQAVARRHGLAAETVAFAQQHPDAIDAGVFHNDVISVGNENVFLYHEDAFVETHEVIERLSRQFAALDSSGELVPIPVSRERVPVAAAVSSYLFNSQIVTLRAGHMALVAPVECQTTPSVRAFLDELLATGRTPIREIRYFDLRESMRNGGGPACLRLRVVLNVAERASLPPGVWLTNTSYDALVSWVEKHYRDVLVPPDLADPQLLDSVRRALDELTQLLGLGAIYEFQR